MRAVGRELGIALLLTNDPGAAGTGVQMRGDHQSGPGAQLGEGVARKGFRTRVVPRRQSFTFSRPGAAAMSMKPPEGKLCRKQGCRPSRVPPRATAVGRVQDRNAEGFEAAIPGLRRVQLCRAVPAQPTLAPEPLSEVGPAFEGASREILPF